MEGVCHNCMGVDYMLMACPPGSQIQVLAIEARTFIQKASILLGLSDWIVRSLDGRGAASYCYIMSNINVIPFIEFYGLTKWHPRRIKHLSFVPECVQFVSYAGKGEEFVGTSSVVSDEGIATPRGSSSGTCGNMPLVGL